MAIHPTRLNRGCGSQNRRCCGRCDTYLNDPPVRDRNPGPSNFVAPVPQIRPPVDPYVNCHTNMYPSDQPPNACIGSPPMGRYDLYDLRYDVPSRRWYWIPRERQQAPIRPQAPVRPQYRSSCCCDSWRICSWKARPEYRRYPNNTMQSVYRTPSGSNLILNRSSINPVQERQPYNPLPQQGPMPPPTHPLSSLPQGAVPIPCPYLPGPNNDPACGETCPGKHAKRKTLTVCQETSTSDSSNECLCDGAQNATCGTCPGSFASCKNPMCCPCRQTDCSCLQNVCCSCAMNLQKQLASKPAKAKKKAKCSKCCCTQTQTTCKDKAVVTNMVKVSDACVCCKPKEKKKPPKPVNKTCFICQRPNMCPARCCPCLLPMPAPQVCYTGQAGSEPEESDAKSADCPHILECRKEASSKPKNCNRCCDPGNCDSTVYDLIRGCNDKTCPTQNLTTNWLQTDLSNTDTSWINNVLLKKSLPTIRQKNFNTTGKFASPLTGTTYNVNMVRIKNRHYKNYATLDPFPTDEAIEQLKKAVDNVKGDPEHRYLVTAVCDALLNNKTKSSFEGGDSSFLDEYTYLNQSDLFLAELDSLNLYNKNKTVSNETLKHFPTSCNAFAQTPSHQLSFNPTAQTLTVKSKSINKQLLTDPINSFFNQMTQTGVDELFEEYLNKIKHSKLFPTIDNAIQSERNPQTSTESFCKMSDFDIFKHTPTQCDKTCDMISTNKQPKIGIVQEKLKTSIPIFKPQYFRLEQKQKTSEDSITRTKKLATIKNESHSDTDSGVGQSMVSVLNAVVLENKQDQESMKIASSNVTKTKRKRSASASDSGTKVILEASKDDHSMQTPTDHHKSCIISGGSLSSLPIRSPRNKKSNESDALVNKSPAMTLKNSSSPYVKRATSPDETNQSKKRKMLPKQHTQKLESWKKVEQQTNKLQNFSRLKSRIPIICPNKFKSSAERGNIGSSSLKSSDVLKQIETTISSLSFVDGKSEKQEDQTKLSKLENPYALDRPNEESESFDYNMIKCEERFTSDVACDETNNSDGEDEHYGTHINTYNNTQHNTSNDTNELVRSISNCEIVISNIKYDNDSNFNVHDDDNEPTENFAFDFPLQNPKSVLSIIKEETESDVNISIPSRTKFLDINTSPFDFEMTHHNFVDSCNSPFELRKQKGKRHPGLSCFSSHEKTSEPYNLAGGSSANEEVERPRTARGIRWLFNL